MQRMICDQLVRCMEKHNRNVVAKRVDPRNEMTMRTCVEIILRNGHVPVVTVQNMDTMKQYQYNISKSKILDGNWTSMPYTKLSLAMKDDGRVREYSVINIPECVI